MQSKAKTNAKPHAGNEKESLGQALYRVFIGIIFGFANIIPGVSGGTAMVVFGVYERIILFITDIRHRLKQDWKFFLPIGIGMAISILFFGSVMDVLLQKHEALMQTFFIGVIVFSVPMIFKEAFGGKRDRSKDLLCAIIFLVVLALMVVMAVLKTDTDQQKEVIKALSRFNFSGNDQGKLCEVLSGGERNRLQLALALKQEGNVLLLDEPTNDIDVNTLRALEEGLDSFAGCAVVISHDRWFLDRICTHILAFEGDGEVVFFEGDYSDYEINKARRLGNTEIKKTRYRKLMED